jgi:uncharacterized membrane protein YeiH
MVRFRASSLVTFVDLVGTFVFGIEGALIAVQNGLDLLGVMVLAFATALGGGIIRDVLLGATPPEALRAWLYPTVAFASGALVLVDAGAVQSLPRSVLIGLDDVGLSLFAVAGAQKALDRGLPSLVAVCLGAITATGGGTIRDMLLTRVPAILRIDVYATAALAGGVVMVVARKVGVPPVLAAVAGGLVCFALRIVAVWEGWNLPRTLGFG